MTKQKTNKRSFSTNKSISKKIKVTSSGKLLRRHQLGSGHLKRKKSKSALNRQKKTYVMAKAENKKYKNLLGI